MVTCIDSSDVRVRLLSDSDSYFEEYSNMTLSRNNHNSHAKNDHCHTGREIRKVSFFFKFFFSKIFFT